MDILQVVRLLQSPEPEVVINASAYLQHLVYRNPNMKERTRQCGGIAALVQLLYSEHVQICQNTVGVLRNLTSGDNLEIKEELERVGGIRALSWLIENRQGYPHPLPHSTDSTTVTDELTVCTGPHAANRAENAPAATATELFINEEFRPTLDSAAAVLCNLAAVNHLKRSVLQEAVIPSLVHTVLKPAACQAVSNDSRTVLREPSFITVLFRNVAAVLRNVSSSEDREVRDRMRQCPHLLWSLITILRSAVRLQCFDTKSVEHCVCCLRNLCFSLQQSTASAAPHLQSVNTQARKSDNLVDTKSQSGSIKLFRSKNSSLKARSYSETETAPDGLDPFPPKSVLNLLYQTGTIQMLVALLQSSSNPCTLEAAAGTIQNLTAGGVLTGPIVRKTVRNLQSLPILVDLISAPTRRVSTAAANALRNLALEEESCLLLGKHALVRILTALGECANSLLSQTVAERHPNGGEWMAPTSTRSGSLLRLSQTLSSSQTQSVYSARSVATALLGLCYVLVRGKLQHARRFVTLGGVETCQEILCNTSDAYQRHSTETLADHTSVERVNQLAHQLLELLWSFVELRPIYKLAGWSETDFGIIKRGYRLSGLVRKRSKTMRHSLTTKNSPSQSNRTCCNLPYSSDKPQPVGRKDSLNSEFSNLELHEEDAHMTSIRTGRQLSSFPNEFYSYRSRESWNDSHRSDSLPTRAVYIPPLEVNKRRPENSSNPLSSLTIKTVGMQTVGTHQQSYKPG